MSAPFFYFPDLDATSDSATLTGDEAQHAAGSRRLRAGDALVLFDGQGGTADATVRGIHDRGRRLELAIGTRSRQPAPTPEIHLASALPKGDRLSTLLDMATQLGITSFTPLRCEHSVVEPSTANLARLRRVCLEACKQSRRAWLPEIRESATPAAIAQRARTHGGDLIVAHPDGEPGGLTTTRSFGPLHLFVGPEGGFSPREVDDLRAAGARTATLGNAILRIETAAVALVVLAHSERPKELS